MSPEDVRRLAWEAVIQSPGSIPLIAAQCRRAFGWCMSQRACEARVSQWFNPRDRHELPAGALPIVIGVTGNHAIAVALMQVKPFARPKREPARVRPAERKAGAA